MLAQWLESVQMDVAFAATHKTPLYTLIPYPVKNGWLHFMLMADSLLHPPDRLDEVLDGILCFLV